MKDLTKGSEARLIIGFSIPLLLGNVFQQLYSTVDAMAVGLKLGKSALAAVGVSGPIVFFMISLIMGLTMGGGVLVSQYFGAKDHERLRRAMHSNYFFVGISSVAVTVVGLLLAEPILRLIGTPADVLDQAVVFLRVTFAGMVFVFGYNAISANMRSLGDSRTPLYFLIFASLLNIGLVLLFVFPLGWGIAGSAWATLIAQAVAFFCSLAYIQRKGGLLRIEWRRLRWEREEMRKILGMSLPSAFQMGMVSLSFIALNAIINPFGTEVLAGYTAAGRLDSFALLPAMNLSMAIATFVGQNMGAGKPERIRRGLAATLAIGGVLSVLTTLLFVLAPASLVGLFENDPAVLRHGVSYLLIVAPFYLLFMVMFVVNGALRGAGAANFSMFATLVATWLARLPASYLFSRWLGADGIWWGIPVGWTVATILALSYYASGRWRKIDLVGRRGPGAHPVVVSADGCVDLEEGAVITPGMVPCDEPHD